ncbi:hypothetical protein ACDX78_13465 [Virgibacillus oceani]
MMKFESNRKQVKTAMDKANENVLTAIGMAGASHVKQVIQTKDLIDTGSLLNSIEHEAEDNSVYIGSTLFMEDYPIVLEKNGNEYLHPGIMNNLGNLRTVAEKAYKL